MKYVAVFLSCFSLSSLALETAYLKIDQPEDSFCELRSTVWVCPGKVRSEDGILLSLATIARGDSLASIETVLRGRSGSTVARSKQRDETWIDATLSNFPAPGWTALVRVTLARGTSDHSEPLILLPAFLLPPGYRKEAKERAYRSLASTRLVGSMKVVRENGSGGPGETPELLKALADFTERYNVLNP